MPSCVAFGCRNRSTKGFKLFVFPRDKERRKQWENKVKLKNWSATNNSYLCECHFEEDQFEQHRADGKRKLKPNAVPTIFGDKRPKPKRKPPKVRRLTTPPPDHPSRRHEIDHQYSKPNSKMPDDVLLDLPFDFQITDEDDERPLNINNIERNQSSVSMVVVENSAAATTEPIHVIPLTVANQPGSQNIYISSGIIKNSTNSNICDARILGTITAIPNVPNDIPKVGPGGKTGGKGLRELQLIKKITTLENKLQHAKRQMTALYRDKLNNAKRIQQLSDSIKMFLNEDQIQSLSHKGPRGIKWSSTTIMKAFQLRFACGSSGYNLLIDQKQPLPSLRTLRRRMKDMTFDSGILYEIFTLVKVKAGAMKADDKLCTLTMGEMNLVASIQDPEGTGNAVGYVTLPDHFGIATHGLVFMLAGIRKCWQQTVAYFFTGGGAEGSILRQIVEEILDLASKCGLHVVAVNSDLGCASQALWHSFGIGVDESNMLVNKIKHPCDDTKDLYFIPDPLHLLKHLKEALDSQSLNLPDEVVKKNSLSSSLVCVQPIELLNKIRQGSHEDILPSSTLKGKKIKCSEKSNVGASFFSLTDAAELQYLAPQHAEDKSFQTLAWFIKTCHKWYNLITRRYPAAFSYHTKKDKYVTAVNFLQSFVEMFSTLNFEEDAFWRLLQISFLLATQSILDIQEESFKGTINYLPAARFTQDCLETLFNSLRSKTPVPSPLEFKDALRGISVVQYLGAAHK